MSVEDELAGLAATASLDYEQLLVAVQQGDLAAIASILSRHGVSLVQDISDARRQSRLRSTPAQYLPEVAARDREIERLSAKCGRQTARIASLVDQVNQLGKISRARIRTDWLLRQAQLRHGVEIRKLRASLRLAHDRLEAAADVIKAKENAIRKVVNAKIEAIRSARTAPPKKRSIGDLLRGSRQ